MPSQRPAHDGGVHVELLVVAGCPHEEAAIELVRDLLDELGYFETPLSVRVVGTLAEAIDLRFTGSPTLLVNGVDPFAQPRQAPALACRIYLTPSGPRGLPDAASVRVVLRGAADPAGGGRH